MLELVARLLGGRVHLLQLRLLGGRELLVLQLDLDFFDPAGEAEGDW
jgi:hypothetical protein